MTFESIIGLEIHAQLSTESKIFCSCPNKFGDEPNKNVCPICLGHPGSLPKLNKKAVEYAILMGIATNCIISPYSTFARKNYFYPDLPKGYQISQYEEPICKNGYIIIETEKGEKKVRLNRIHLEEDAGKSIHDQGEMTKIDLNRCGAPLIEIVTEPDIRSPQEARIFLATIRQLLRYLKISDANMEEGSLRCDANVSIRPIGEKKLGAKTEIKNMNSLRFVEKAIEYEIQRQIELYDERKQIVQETRLWNPNKEITLSMRSKEDAQDYRYFPDPDLLPVVVDDKLLQEISNKLPELPKAKKKRFIEEYKIPKYNAEVITSDIDIANYFETVAKVCEDPISASNWVMVEVLKVLNEKNISILDFSIAPAMLGKLIQKINNKTISSKIAKEIFAEMLVDPKDPDILIKEKGLTQITSREELKKVVDEILQEFPEQVKQYRQGSQKVIGFLIGALMKKTNGKANPQIGKELLEEMIKNSNL